MRVKSKVGPKTSFTNNSKLKLYGIVIAILLIVALAALVLPKSTGLERCLGIFLTSNKDACLISLAYSTDNQSVCSYIQDSSAGSCYSSIAIADLSPSMCANAGSNQSSANCVSQIANTTSNPSLCSNLNQPYKDSCLLGVSIYMASTASCTLIENQTLGIACGSIINLKLAALTSNPAYCPIVSNETNRSIVVPVINYDKGLFSRSNQTQTIASLSGFEFMQENYSARDLCYVLIASKTQNQSFCASTSPYAQGICNYASSKNSTTSPGNYSQLLSDCGTFSQYSTQCTQYAQLGQAVATKNVTICSALPENLSWDCFSSIASQYNNATYCTYIKNATANNACILQLNYSN